MKDRKWTYFGLGFLLLGLVGVKILLSGIFLDFSALGFSTPSLAVAGDRGVSDKTPAAPEASPEPSSETLERKAQELRAKELELQKREQELLPLKAEIEEKLAQLNELQLRLTAYAKQLADREKALEDAKMAHLVALYSAMEPARAAAIMDKLKIQTVVLILRHMKGKSAGKILAMMNPERGALISEKLAHLN
ncbi:MAG: hypothetical protein JRH13_09315 [Deltaproteobacteria bacterium]|nr:hypothetical protein [Deltaproteobacteria bacterium]MBW2015411.1 hypothetical protein [Deltaproteobacteria bacterium]MBW2129548.1 hypothetical protein [Deltaproteobacteria bacterium]MBW2302780.1 hypothetical protein [Deltaproteobacteria bacterium]